AELELVEHKRQPALHPQIHQAECGRGIRCGVLNHIEHNPTRVERGHSRLCSIWNIKDRNLTVLTSMHQIRCNFRSLRDSSIIASRNKVAYVPQSFVTD
ncbi:LOW QUALITY PROTEIN: predicted protein, partial [Brucella ceti M644/93/1]